MDNNLDIQLEKVLKADITLGVEDQLDYQKFYLYFILPHSTAIEVSTVTEIGNQLLFDEDIAAKSRSLTEQMKNVYLKDACLHIKTLYFSIVYQALCLILGTQCSRKHVLRLGTE